MSVCKESVFLRDFVDKLVVLDIGTLQSKCSNKVSEWDVPDIVKWVCTYLLDRFPKIFKNLQFDDIIFEYVDDIKHTIPMRILINPECLIVTPEDRRPLHMTVNVKNNKLYILFGKWADTIERDQKQLIADRLNQWLRSQ